MKHLHFTSLHGAIAMAAHTGLGHELTTKANGTKTLPTDGIIKKATGASQVPTGQIGGSDLKSSARGSTAMFAAPTEETLGRGSVTTEDLGVQGKADVEDVSTRKSGGAGGGVPTMQIGDGLKSTQIAQAPCFAPETGCGNGSMSTTTDEIDKGVQRGGGLEVHGGGLQLTGGGLMARNSGDSDSFLPHGPMRWRGGGLAIA